MQIGQNLGAYRLTALLGKGGMGEVFPNSSALRRNDPNGYGAFRAAYESLRVLGAKIISHDYSRYDMDDEVVLVKDSKFVMVLGHVPSHSVLVRQGERIFAIGSPDSTNNSRIFEVTLPRDSRGK